ncbi:MAG: SLC13 family permease, partial [Pyrinomonadaceae bacterium]
SMNFEMIFVFGVLLLAVYLFVTEKLPVDLVALTVMALLLVSGIVTPADGLAGFSNAATVTIAAMFILSAGLFRTGAVTNIGVFVHRIFKNSFWLAILIVMVIVGFISIQAFAFLSGPYPCLLWAFQTV